MLFHLPGTIPDYLDDLIKEAKAEPASKSQFTNT